MFVVWFDKILDTHGVWLKVKMIINLSNYDLGVLFGSFIGAGVGAIVSLMVWFVLEFIHKVLSFFDEDD